MGAHIKHCSYYTHEEEVLIPGYEVYHKVTAQNDNGYNEIFLDSPERKKSNFNCFYNGSAQTVNIDFSISGESVCVRDGAGRGPHEMEEEVLPT